MSEEDTEMHRRFMDAYEFHRADFLITPHSEKVHLINPKRHATSYCGNSEGLGMIIRGVPECSHRMICRNCMESREKEVSDE